MSFIFSRLIGRLDWNACLILENRGLIDHYVSYMVEKGGDKSQPYGLTGDSKRKRDVFCRSSGGWAALCLILWSEHNWCTASGDKLLSPRVTKYRVGTHKYRFRYRRTITINTPGKAADFMGSERRIATSLQETHRTAAVRSSIGNFYLTDDGFKCASGAETVKSGDGWKCSRAVL